MVERKKSSVHTTVGNDGDGDEDLFTEKEIF